MFHLLILSKIVAKECFHELPPPLPIGLLVQVRVIPLGSVKMAGAHLFTWLETFIINMYFKTIYKVMYFVLNKYSMSFISSLFLKNVLCREMIHIDVIC